MNSDRWQRIQDLFDELIAIAPQQRERFLDQECGDDRGLRSELEALLEGSLEGTQVIEGVLGRTAEAATETFRTKGERVGAYRLLDAIGHGGMGTVYLAERADREFQHKVAIKLLRAGSLSDKGIARFRAERQILASLDHPFIARLLDGGTTSEGMPYFVMEYVEGVPIDEFCDARRLTTKQRLDLFRQVCSAVASAHQNLIVHRDIKPSNILVTPEGAPKLLDFGIAKLVEPDVIEQGSLTAAGEKAMTPEYASPEQVRGEPVTTATDVYGLGLLLSASKVSWRTRATSSAAATVVPATSKTTSSSLIFYAGLRVAWGRRASYAGCRHE